MPIHPEPMAGCDINQGLGDRFGLELDQFPALATDQMVVLGISVVVLEDVAIFLAGDLANQADSSIWSSVR